MGVCGLPPNERQAIERQLARCPEDHRARVRDYIEEAWNVVGDESLRLYGLPDWETAARDIVDYVIHLVSMRVAVDVEGWTVGDVLPGMEKLRRLRAGKVVSDYVLYWQAVS
jgi:hypothetical protein